MAHLLGLLRMQRDTDTKTWKFQDEMAGLASPPPMPPMPGTFYTKSHLHYERRYEHTTIY